jgi:hypothetical protein
MTSYISYTFDEERCFEPPIYREGKDHELKIYNFPHSGMCKFKPSAVGISSQGNIVDKKNRTSFTAIDKFKIKFSDDHYYDDIHEELIKLLPEKYKNYPVKFEFPDCTLLKYIKGSFFKTHVDGKKSENHFATGLLYPRSDYTGGELYIYENENKLQIKKSRHWQFIAIKLGTPHEVTEIKSGERYVFKFNIMMDDVNFIPNKICYKPIKSTKQQNIWDELLHEVKEKFVENTNVNVILTSYYRYPMPQTLNEKDTILYNAILYDIPNSIISFENIKTKYTEDCEIEGKLDDEYAINHSLPDCTNIDDDSYIYQSDDHVNNGVSYQTIDYAAIMDTIYCHYIKQHTVMKITTGITDKLISGIVTILPSVLIDIIMEYVH